MDRQNGYAHNFILTPGRRTASGGLVAGRAPHRGNRIGVETAEGDDTGPRFLNPVAERGQTEVAGREYRTPGVGRFDLGHTLRILGEGLAADDEVVGVEHVPQQCHRLTEHARAFAQQVDGPSSGTIRSLRAAVSTASSLTVDSNWPLPPSISDCTGKAAIVPGPLVGECTRPPIDRAYPTVSLA